MTKQTPYERLHEEVNHLTNKELSLRKRKLKSALVLSGRRGSNKMAKVEIRKLAAQVKKANPGIINPKAVLPYWKIK